MVTVTQTSIVDTHIKVWQEAHNSERSATDSLQSAVNQRDAAYSQMGNWDACINRLPTFVSSTFLSDPEEVSHYNELTTRVKDLWKAHFALQERKEQIEGQIIRTVVHEQESENAEFKACHALLQRLNLLAQTCRGALQQLKRAENSEWWDGMSSDNNYRGSYSDFRSREDNFRVAQMLQNLNQQVVEFNTELALKPSQVAIGALKELYRAGDAIVEAELAESSFITLFTGDYWQSRNTLYTIQRVTVDTRALESQIENSQRLVQSKVKEFVIQTLNQSHPDFVLESGIEMKAFSI